MRTLYQAFDGRTFSTAKECKDYEWGRGRGVLTQLLAQESKFFVNNMTDEIRDDLVDAIISNKNKIIEILAGLQDG
jgi:hypothetical protein